MPAHPFWKVLPPGPARVGDPRLRRRKLTPVRSSARLAPKQIVVDLRGVEHIDDTGIGTLVVSTRVCRQLGIDLAVRLPSPLLRNIFGPRDTRGQAGRPDFDAAPTPPASTGPAVSD